MRVKTAKKPFFLFFCFSLLFLYGCGDMEVVLPGNGTYQIKALVNNTSLEENSLIRDGETIRPYCDTLLSNDPDVSGLLVLIQNAQKETVGGRILYTLRDELPASLSVEAKEEKNDDKENEADADGEEAESSALNNDVENNIETTVIKVRSLDVQLPIFTLPEDLRVGLYTFVFRVLGDKDTFSETEQNFFYLGNSRFDLKDLNMYLPGGYAESQLIRPGTKVLLEAVIETEGNINPYIVWHNGKKIIAEGFASDGAGTVFFEAPTQNALQTIRAEIFPALARPGMNGVSREIVLPISAKVGDPEFFAGTALADFSRIMTKNKPQSELALPPELMCWYQFAGTLNDANGKNELSAVLDRKPRFSPMGHTYGLSTGSYEAYNAPGISFVQENEANGGGAFLFRIKPIADGNILNVVFDSPFAARQVSMHLLAEEGNIVLRLNVGEVTREMAIPAGDGATVTAAIVFYLLPDRLEAKLVPEEKSPDQVRAIYVRLREPLNGKCSVSLGNQNASIRDQNRSRNYSWQNLPASAIWNELAVFYVSPPDFVLLEPDETEISQVGIKNKPLSNTPENV